MSTPGPVALAGSGEFLPVMKTIDHDLLLGRMPLAAIIPTAAALEGEGRLRYWLDLARTHFESMGVEAVPVPVVSRGDAQDPALAARLDDVGMVYLSGGDPHYLSATLRDSVVWSAVLRAWRSGAALAGCSAGAMALSAGAPVLPGRGPRPPVAEGEQVPPAVVDCVANGLEVVPGLAVIPHFDLMERWEGAMESFRRWQPLGTLLVGIEEETVLVGDGSTWQVAGAGAVWVFDAGASPRRLGSGQELVPTS